MHKIILLFAFVLAGLLGGGYWLLETNPDFKEKAQDWGIIDGPLVPPPPPSHHAVFLIFDPSGSGSTAYSVPRLTAPYIGSVIDSIAAHGSGEVWLTYIDKNAQNNRVLHFEALAAKAAPAKARASGELKADYDKRMRQLAAVEKEQDASVQAFQAKKNQFLTDCQAMIDEGYAPKKRGEDYSDCIGSLNTALRSLETMPHDATHFRSVLFISDGVQSSPKGFAPAKLGTLPDDMKIITVNHSGSKHNVVEGQTIEVDNLDRGLAKILSKNH